MRSKFQTALEVLYPPRCVSCGAAVEQDFGLCGSCWKETPFIEGLLCNACGVPLPGESDDPDVLCDDCMQTPRPWTAGRAAVLYQDRGRQIVLSLKHGGRTDVARMAAQWLERAARPFLAKNPILAPIPLHWARLLRRSFNQSALLAHALARRTGAEVCPDLLLRTSPTASLDHRPAAERFAILDSALSINPRRQAVLEGGRPVLLIDDVMTSGATFHAATEACQAAGSGDVFVLALARVAKDA